ncbi:MAG TPA: ATP-binding protein [Gemmataceae bacterium]|nr:ATP-binding protein [Gemmataceae bacterium]
MWHNLTIFKKGLVLISVPLLFQLAFFGLLSDMQHSNAQAVRWSIHSKEVLRQTQVVLRSLLEMGTGLRGFILAADPDLHAAYQRAAQQLPRDVLELQNFVSDNQVQAAQVQGIANAIEGFMVWHAETVRLSGTGHRDRAIARAKSQTSSRLQTAIVKAMMTFIQTEDALDKERALALDQSQTRQRWLLWCSAGTTFLITLGLAFVFSGSIGGRLATLTDNARRLAAGETLAPPVRGRDEVAQLDLAFRRMAQELAQSAQSLRRSAEEIRALYEQAKGSAEEIRRLNESLERRITERTAELGRANEALREAGRRKDEFLAMLAHELRNPLAPIRTGLQIIKKPDSDLHAVDKARTMMERQVRHLTRIVDDLLDVSRITRGQIALRPERLDLARLARDTTDDHRAAFEQAGLTLNAAVPETPVWVMADATRVAQVLGNLLHNAAKFTDRGGNVTVRVALDGDRRQAVLSVRDTGTGIEPEMLPCLFDAFAQADRSLDRSKGGLGLGLALVRGLVELHGGEVRAASAGPGRGAEFTVRLSAQPEPAALSNMPAAPTRATTRLRILVVEDNRDSADMLRILLELCGYEVAVAHTGPAGVQTAKEWRPDVVLCDIGLPGMDGYGVVGELRRHPATAATRVIAVTGYGTDDDRRKSREAGFDQHLTKPVDPEALERLFIAPAGRAR